MNLQNENANQVPCVINEKRLTRKTILLNRSITIKYLDFGILHLLYCLLLLLFYVFMMFPGYLNEKLSKV